MKHAVIFGLAALVISGSAAAQYSTRFGVPGYSYESTTTYSTSRDHYNQSRSNHLRDLQAGRNFNNPVNGAHSRTTRSHTYGVEVYGVGASRTVPGRSSYNVAAEDALARYNRDRQRAEFHRERAAAVTPCRGCGVR